ncbi:hypothetical protein [Pseudalkalibacillus decolorationis]|uniref:hypothetical protein n=1 Tax=Pseudalkalibacillus decolorationis TaxID=163879 RepID=UPI0021483CB0|nr:hypothetical protein [Pseudalkalibacillus decolorationis]
MDVADEQNRGFLIGKYNELWGLGGLAGMLFGGILSDLIGVEMVTLIFADALGLGVFWLIKIKVHREWRPNA